MVAGPPSPLKIGFSQSFRVLFIDSYANYLVAVNDQTPVLVAENIYDENSDLLLPARQRFDIQALKTLRGRRLAKPLELYLQVDESLTADQLQDDISALVQKDHFFSALEEHRPFLKGIVDCLADLDAHFLLQQKLTVMTRQMPGLYHRSLYTLVLSALLADELRLPLEEKHYLYWASLYHDIGMLHLNPLVLNKTDPLTAEDWAHIQTHVNIAQALMGWVPGLPEAVIDAAAEHQERCDGTGYPTAKVESELTLLGQVLGLADSSAAIYVNRLKRQGRGWRDVVPIIELNAQEYLFRAVELLTGLIRRSDLPLSGVVSGSSTDEFLERVRIQHQQLQIWFTRLSDCLLGIGYTHGDRKLHALQNVVLHIATAYKGAVSQQGDFLKEIDELLASPVKDIPRTMEDACLLQQELMFHLLKLSRMMQQYLSFGGSRDGEIQKRLELCFDQIRDYVK